MTAKVVVIGATGFIGAAAVARLRGALDVVTVSRRAGAADVHLSSASVLDEVLDGDVTQVLLTAQLGGDDVDAILARIDGPRWVVLSSAQLGAQHLPPSAALAVARESFAVSRGALVLRPTMVFGRGRDGNVSRLIRMMRRVPVVPLPDGGEQIVQPLHVDDLLDAIDRHRAAPCAGLLEIGGDEPLPMIELVVMIAEVLGVRVRTVALPMPALRSVGRIAGLRADQVARLVEDKAVDLAPIAAALGWAPAPLAHRIEQAVDEVVAHQ